MLAILSPAKRLVEGPAVPELPHTLPELLDDTRTLAGVTRRLRAKDVRSLMDVSEELAVLNVARFQALADEPTPGTARQAALSFAGDTYLGLDAPSLTADELGWAQDHVAILSGLYGLLRPLDLMQPYRLEMGTRLKTRRGGDLYAFWGDRIARALERRLEGHADRTLLNLASEEYAKAARLDALGVRVVTPVFQDTKDGKARTLFMFAKKARGATARWLVQHRPAHTDALREATIDGYRLVPDESTDTRWIFRREQPPPVR